MQHRKYHSSLLKFLNQFIIYHAHHTPGSDCCFISTNSSIKLDHLKFTLHGQSFKLWVSRMLDWVRSNRLYIMLNYNTSYFKKTSSNLEKFGPHVFSEATITYILLVRTQGHMMWKMMAMVVVHSCPSLFYHTNDTNIYIFPGPDCSSTCCQTWIHPSIQRNSAIVDCI